MAEYGVDTGAAGNANAVGSDNTVGNLNANFKETYADKLNQLIPEGVKFINMISFMSKDKQPGNLFHQPVGSIAA